MSEAFCINTLLSRAVRVRFRGVGRSMGISSDCWSGHEDEEWRGRPSLTPTQLVPDVREFFSYLDF